MSAPEGRTLGSYRLLERIGKGGMGEVYRARHVKLGREAAVKILPPALAAEPDFLKRFEREAASAAALNHPNILQVYDYGDEHGVPYLVMPYISGGTLKDRLVNGTITPGQFARALTEVAGALDYAHRQGIVHRDVKPANVLLDDYERAYLADFGIAKALAEGEALTQTGLGVGTPEYMAPEQAQGRAEPRSDLYALGIMLFQLLTGQVPYSGASTVEVLLKHLQEPIPLGVLRGPAAREFGPILTRALAKDPAGRYPTGRELMDNANTALARIGYADAGGSAAYHSGATQGPPRGTPPPTTGTPASELTMQRPQGTPLPSRGTTPADQPGGMPPEHTQWGHRPTSGGPLEPPRATTPPPPPGQTNTPPPANAASGTGTRDANVVAWPNQHPDQGRPAPQPPTGPDAAPTRFDAQPTTGPDAAPTRFDAQAPGGAAAEATRFGPDDATRFDPSGRAGTPPPPPNQFGSALPQTQFGTAPPRGQGGTPPPPNAYQPPFGGMAPVQQVASAGGGPLANMDPNTRRLVIIIAIVVAVVFLLCCCLFGLSLLGGR